MFKNSRSWKLESLMAMAAVLMTQCIPQTQSFMHSSLQNSTNAPGMTLLPSQFRVLTCR